MSDRTTWPGVRAAAAVSLGLTLLACGPPAEPPAVQQARAQLDEAWARGAIDLKRLTLSLLVDHERLPEAHAIVEEAMASPSSAMRLEALSVLSAWEDPNTAELLRPHLEDSSEIVRLVTARILARLGHADGRPILAEAMRDADGLLATEVCAALAAIGGDECAAAAAGDLSARDTARVRAAAAVLAETGGEDARVVLRNALGSLRGEKRAAAIEALGRIGTAEDVARLRPFARYTVYVLAVIRALGDIGGEPSIRALHEFLDKEDPLAALEAAGALLKAEGPVDPVLAVLDASIARERTEVRYLAARLIAEAPPRTETEERLVRLAQDSEPPVRREALAGLARGATPAAFDGVRSAWEATRAAPEGPAYEAAQRALVAASRIPGEEADAMLEEAMSSDNWAHILQASFGILERHAAAASATGG